MISLFLQIGIWVFNNLDLFPTVAMVSEIFQLKFADAKKEKQ